MCVATFNLLSTWLVACQVLRRHKTLSRAGVEPVALYEDWMDDDSSHDSSSSSSEDEDQQDQGQRTPPLQRVDEETGAQGTAHLGGLEEEPTRPPSPPCYWDAHLSSNQA